MMGIVRNIVMEDKREEGKEDGDKGGLGREERDMRCIGGNILQCWGKNTDR